MTRYGYDALDHRVSRVGPDGVTRFLIDRQSLTGYSQTLRETDAAG